jgi:hypothetical protein
MDDVHIREVKGVEKRMSEEANAIGMQIQPAHFTVQKIYCILASCYIRLTLNICSFVRQCNTFTS